MKFNHNSSTIFSPCIGLLATIASVGVFCLHTATAATTIVEENFGGSGDPLDGTTADTFAGGITSAGGSDEWVAASSFNDDGSLVNGDNEGAYLNVGSYINDSKGTATGKFALTATIGSVPVGNWAGFGFFESNTPSTSANFTAAGALGAGFFIYRADGELDGFAGPGSSNGVDGPNGQSGSQLLTIVLDLTPTGGYNGTSDFGTVTFYQGDEDTGSSLGSHTYTSTISFGSVGLSTAGSGGAGVDATFSDFELTQVPEPSIAFLGSLGVFLLLRRRR